MTRESPAIAIGLLFGPSAQVCVWSGEEVPDLYPEEQSAIERAVIKRRVEFAQGRAAAREALSRLGVLPRPIPVGPNREPVWPDGYVGSITHCEGLVATVAAHEPHFLALGIDAEPARALPEEVRGLVLHPSEMVADPLMEAIVFSAKESIHKALFPLTGAWMDFLDVEVQLEHAGGALRISPTAGGRETPPELELLQGGFVCTSGFVVTGCWIPGPGCDPER